MTSDTSDLRNRVLVGDRGSLWKTSGSTCEVQSPNRCASFFWIIEPHPICLAMLQQFFPRPITVEGAMVRSIKDKYPGRGDVALYRGFEDCWKHVRFCDEKFGVRC